MKFRESIRESLLENLGESVKFDLPLAPHTSFRIGGPADFFFEALSPWELINAVLVSRSLGIEYFILGGGSNLLVSDAGFRGLVIKNGCTALLTDGDTPGVQSGFWLNDLVERTADLGLSGLEFLAGIPGTVGGAIYGNAGAFGKSIGDLLERGVVFDPDRGFKTVERDYFEFNYRSSKLKRSAEIVVSASFHLESKTAAEVKSKVEEVRALRKEKHPQKQGSIGCFFKNIEENGKTIPVGRLLEQVGAKEMVVGNAAVFDRHANIIVNRGGARSSEVRRLTDILKKRVQERFGYLLEPEVVFLGEEPDAT
jgi:UDP-N-acetylmuramate dehydrogenase